MLATAADTGMPLQEETITDMLLLQLTARCPGSIKVIPFAKREEAKVGADWEWWFCDRPKGVGFRVQAKRIFTDRWHFNSLKFPVRGPSQTDILIEEAREGVVPLYCFYVFQSRSIIRWNSRSIVPRAAGSCAPTPSRGSEASSQRS